jgi:protoporphyrinogen oxidase
MNRGTLSRRDVLKLLSKLSCTLYLAPLAGAGCGLSRALVPPSSRGSLDTISPIDRTLPEGRTPRVFFGDNPHSSHAALWNKSGFIAEKGGLPVPCEERAVVVVGGGVAGLVSAYQLRELNPLVLERDLRFGGNSKGQSWHGIDYSIGAAYFCAPDRGSFFDTLLAEIGLGATWKRRVGEDPVALSGRLVSGFWEGANSGKRSQHQFEQLTKYCKRLLEGNTERYPDIPVIDESARGYVNSLDRITLREHLEARMGALNRHLLSAIEHFCWSSFGASSSEISAAAGMNFLASEFADLGVLPGGNAAIAEAVLARLDQSLTPGSLRTGALVVDVRTDESGVTVTHYDTATDELRAVRAKALVMACPKFIAAKIVDGIEEDRVAAIQRLEYRAYVVANALVEGSLDYQFYDLFLLGDATTTGMQPINESRARGITDVVFANFASTQRNQTVLTLYQALPYKQGRAELLNDSSYEAIRARFEKQIASEILPLLGIASDRVFDLRIARWGHPLPVAAKGLIADGVVDRIHAPFRERVFFIEQDNWALPAIETSLAEAERWASKVKAFLS